MSEKKTAATPIVTEGGADQSQISPVYPPPSTTEQGSTTTKTIAGTVTTQSGNVVAAPTSTEEEERISLGQRTVNLIWEHTQMKVALSVIWAALLVAAVLAVLGKYLGSPDIQLAAVVFLFGVANLVTGFYFGRTNHQRIGGVEQGR
jgi:hypothetical protein